MITRSKTVSKKTRSDSGHQLPSQSGRVAKEPEMSMRSVRQDSLGSFSSASSATVVARQLEAKANHARRLSDLEAERQRAEAERAAIEREKAVAELELQAELAAIEAASFDRRSRASSRSSTIPKQVQKWFDDQCHIPVNNQLSLQVDREVLPARGTIDVSEAPRPLPFQAPSTSLSALRAGDALRSGPMEVRPWLRQGPSTSLPAVSAGDVLRTGTSFQAERLPEAVHHSFDCTVGTTDLVGTHKFDLNCNNTNKDFNARDLTLGTQNQVCYCNKTFPTQAHADSDVSKLARAIADLAGSHATRPVSDLKLPAFDGRISDWLVFKRMFNHSKGAFSQLENIARLNQAVRGVARDAVGTLLLSSDDPEEVMSALESSFARPEFIVLDQIAQIRSLSKLGSMENSKELCKFACRVRNCVDTIRLLSQPEYLASPELANSIISKLTPLLRSRWVDYASTSDGSMFKLELLSKFLSRETDLQIKFGLITESVTPDLHGANHRDVRRSDGFKTDRHLKVYAVTASGSQSPKSVDSLCRYCSATQHKIENCQEFHSLTIDDRWRWVTENKVCYKCFKRGQHSYKRCRQSCNVPDCKLKRAHHTLLHRLSEASAHVDVEEGPLASSAPTPCPEGSKPDTNEVNYNVKVQPDLGRYLEVPTAALSSVALHASYLQESRRPLLKVIGVTIVGPKGSVDTLALLDDGSSATFIDADIATEIGATGPKSQVNVKCVGGLAKRTAVEYVDFSIKGRMIDSPTFEIRGARSMFNLGITRQTLRESQLNFDHLIGLEGLCYEDAQPKVIIGVDNWHLSLPLEVRKGTRSQPVACRTALGWVIFGFSSSKSSVTKFFDQNVNHISEETERVDTLFKEYLKLDSVGIEKKDYHSPDDERAISLLSGLTRRLPSGRFETCLPWKDGILDVPKSYTLALSRFLNLEKKFQRDKQYAEGYKVNIHSMIDKNYAELCVKPPQASGVTWYLPHFGVVHPQKRKLRVVHDAAASSQGVSLNSMLLQGPDLLQPLLSILMRFREGQIALNGDIREMFPQTKIRVEDRDAQRFLWRDDPSEPIREYRMSSMIFGASSSPFTALYLKNLNAEEHRNAFPEAARAIIEDHYMDDFLNSVDSVEDAARLVSDIVKVHSKACLEMRSWVSNREEALASLPVELRAPSQTQVGLTTPQSMTASVKILGVTWNIIEDSLGFRALPSPLPSKWTKRCVLSQLMRVYDPLGLLTPVTIRGRILFQQTWKLGIDWDVTLSPPVISKWEGWFRELIDVAKFTVPRCYLKQPNPVDRQLHLFADASESAYCCVAYWRFVHSDGSVELALIGGKARLAPLKPVSMPRLELQAALVASRFATYVTGAHKHKPSKTFFWSDSLTVLKWLRSDARTFKAFVAHRVGEISESSDISSWRYVPTALNVADDATRAQSKFQVDRWFSGPPFLLLPFSDWPREPSQISFPLASDELKCSQELVGLTTVNPSEPPLPVVADPSHFSGWMRLVRATARVHLCAKTFLSVIGKCSVTNPSIQNFPRALIASDIIVAERLLLQKSQLDSFAVEIEHIRLSAPLPKNSRLKNVLLYIDENGLLRLSSRILAVKNTPPTRDLQPAVLDGHHPAVRLFIAHIHQSRAHGGIESIVNEIRSRFYVLHLRPSVKSVISRCQICRIRKATPRIPSFGDLPPGRLAHHERPFTHVGVDYFGPVNITIGRRHEKRYVALFTCLTIRAVHLEIVASLSTDSALMALRRLIARRGCPSDIYSDNGTAFVGAARKLSELYNFVANNRINWHFIPPAAPFMGGCWERLVRSVKVALSTTLKERAPKEEILHTLLLEAEAVVNSRPLTHVAVGPDDEEALTPFHFLLGGSQDDRSLCARTDADLCSREGFKKGLRLADHFWTRWTREVLPCLVARRPAEGGPKVNCGDPVLIVDGSLPRASWPRGRVVKVFPGRDGKVRTVEVATKGGIFKRPIRVLVPLVSTYSPS